MPGEETGQHTGGWSMDLLWQALEWVRNLNVNLNALADQLGPWFYVLMFAIIFAETGLVVTPFLPGDSLLFALGAMLALPGSNLSLPLMLGVLATAAILGDAVNYAIGAWFGPAVFRSRTSWLFNVKHLQRAQEFYEKYGPKTIILARFVPIVRTFAPFVAGIGTMSYPRFALYNVVGGILWVLICTLAGLAFGNIEWVKSHFELVVVAIIVISVLPMAFEFYLAWRKKAPNPEPVGAGVSEAE
jgi:membrane-associated protein